MYCCEFCDEPLESDSEEYFEATCIAVCDECAITHADEIHEEL